MKSWIIVVVLMFVSVAQAEIKKLTTANTQSGSAIQSNQATDSASDLSPAPAAPSAPAEVPPPAPLYGSRSQSVSTDIKQEDDFLHYNRDNVNLRFYPFDVFLGGMRADLLFRNGDNSWAVGPTAEKLGWDLGIFKTSSWGVGLTSTYGFGRPAFSHGWYLSPEVRYRAGSISINNNLGDSAQANYHIYTGTLTAGYHWYWKSFNLALGLGASYSNITLSSVETYTTDQFGTSVTSSNGNPVSASAFSIAADFIMGFTF